MLRFVAIVIVEAFVGMGAAGVLLAVMVPLLIEHHIIEPGDMVGAVLIASVVILAICGALFRPGSALRRSKS